MLIGFLAFILFVFKFLKICLVLKLSFEIRIDHLNNSLNFDNSSFEVSKGYLTVLMILIKPRNSIYYYSSIYMKFFLFCRIVRHREVSSYLFDTFSVLYTKSITTLATILAFKLCLPTHALTLFLKN